MRTSIPHRRPQLERAAQTLCLFALVLAISAVAGTGAPAANAATKASPCWNKLINDWYDGRIDHAYPVHCYRDALKHLPQDVRTYSDAVEVINRALASATRDQHSNQNTIIPPPGNSGGGSGDGGGPGAGPGGGTGSSQDPGTGAETTAGGGFLNDGANALGSDRADSVPVPLLVLAGLALLLVAAGAAGLIARRVQSRRAQP